MRKHLLVILLKKVKYIVLLRQNLAFMLDQDKSLFLQKKRPPKGVFWVHARLDKAFKHPFRNSKSPYGGKWASEELFAGNIYDEQITSKK